MDNKEQCRKLANRIYELDEKVYKTSGSGLGMRQKSAILSVIMVCQRKTHLSSGRVP